MKRLTIVILGVFIYTSAIQAQKHELGVKFARSFFLGDLGGLNATKMPVVKNMEFKTWHFYGGVFHRYLLREQLYLKSSVNVGQLAGDDALTSNEELYTEQWLKNYRNLHFKSTIIDIEVVLEYNFLDYILGDKTYRMSPYLAVGLGFLYHNPRAEYQGNWIDLKGLGTEGQGLITGNTAYRLLQPNIPLSAGFKFNLNHAIVIGIDLTYKFTFTDFLDDVSGDYVALNDFRQYYTYDEANTIYALSRRSMEIDPSDQDGSYTTAGMQRGDNQKFDNYFLIGIQLSWKVHTKNYRCFGTW